MWGRYDKNDELLLSLLQMSARGLERIGDVFSSIGMTQQIYYGMKFKGMGWPPVKDNGRTHTTTNQKHAAIMEDRRERRCGHWGGESLLFGDNIVGRGILMKNL